jgi:F-type H+-transporting ATPase subunit b
LDKIDWTLWLQAGNFVLLIVILQRLLYRPLQAILDQRQARRESAEQRSRDLEAQVVEQQQVFDEQLSQARQQAQQARLAALEQAQQEEARLLGQAHDEAAQTLAQVRRKVAEQVETEVDRLRNLTAHLGNEVAARLLGRPL